MVEVQQQTLVPAGLAALEALVEGVIPSRDCTRNELRQDFAAAAVGGAERCEAERLCMTMQAAVTSSVVLAGWVVEPVGRWTADLHRTKAVEVYFYFSYRF